MQSLLDVRSLTIPRVPNLAAILATMQQGFMMQQKQQNEQDAILQEAITSLSGDTQGLSDNVNQMGTTFEREVQ